MYTVHVLEESLSSYSAAEPQKPAYATHEEAKQAFKDLLRDKVRGACVCIYNCTTCTILYTYMYIHVHIHIHVYCIPGVPDHTQYMYMYSTYTIHMVHVYMYNMYVHKYPFIVLFGYLCTRFFLPRTWLPPPHGTRL